MKLLRKIKQKYRKKLKHPEFEIEEVFPKSVANLINNISCILNPRCIKTYILHVVNMIFFFQVLFYTLLAFSNDVSKFCIVTSSRGLSARLALVRWLFFPKPNLLTMKAL